MCVCIMTKDQPCGHVVSACHLNTSWQMTDCVRQYPKFCGPQGSHIAVMFMLFVVDSESSIWATYVRNYSYIIYFQGWGAKPLCHVDFANLPPTLQICRELLNFGVL